MRQALLTVPAVEVCPAEDLATDQAATMLGPSERKDLERLEGVIENAIQSWVRAGQLLKEIRDKGYWRPDGSFPNYLRRRWHTAITESYASRVIVASDLYGQMKSLTMGKDIPDSERVIRELVPLHGSDKKPDPARAAQVWSVIAAKAKALERPVTARMVREHVQEVLGKKREPKSPGQRLFDLFQSLSPADKARCYEMLRRVYPLAGPEPDQADPNVPPAQKGEVK
jgi:hypothetical protein